MRDVNVSDLGEPESILVTMKNGFVFELTGSWIRIEVSREEFDQFNALGEPVFQLSSGVNLAIEITDAKGQVRGLKVGSRPPTRPLTSEDVASLVRMGRQIEVDNELE